MARIRHPHRSWWEPVLELGTHLLGAAAMFTIFAAPAIGLDYATKWLKRELDTSDIVVWILDFIKLFTLIADSLLYVVFFVDEFGKFIDKLLHGED